MSDEKLRRLGQTVLATTGAQHAVMILVSRQGEVVVTCDHALTIDFASSNQLVKSLLEVACKQVSSKVARPD